MMNSVGAGLAGNGFGVSLQGMQKASDRLAQSAQRVASAGTQNTEENTEVAPQPPVDLANEAVEQTMASYDFKANLKAFKAQEEMYKTVLNTLA